MYGFGPIVIRDQIFEEKRKIKFIKQQQQQPTKYEQIAINEASGCIRSTHQPSKYKFYLLFCTRKKVLLRHHPHHHNINTSMGVYTFKTKQQVVES